MALARRVRFRVVGRLTLFSGWVWIAAVSFVGFEAFEVIFGTFILAPELLPVVLIGLVRGTSGTGFGGPGSRCERVYVSPGRAAERVSTDPRGEAPSRTTIPQWGRQT